MVAVVWMAWTAFTMAAAYVLGRLDGLVHLNRQAIASKSNIQKRNSAETPAEERQNGN